MEVGPHLPSKGEHPPQIPQEQKVPSPHLPSDHLYPPQVSPGPLAHTPFLHQSRVVPYLQFLGASWSCFSQRGAPLASCRRSRRQEQTSTMAVTRQQDEAILVLEVLVWVVAVSEMLVVRRLREGS